MMLNHTHIGSDRCQLILPHCLSLLRHRHPVVPAHSDPDQTQRVSRKAPSGICRCLAEGQNPPEGIKMGVVQLQATKIGPDTLLFMVTVTLLVK